MFLEAGVDKESNGLVRALFDDGRCKALVGATYTSVCDVQLHSIASCTLGNGLVIT